MTTELTSRVQLSKALPGTNEPFNTNTFNANLNKLDAAVGATICTSTSRPASPYPGQLIYETDSKKQLMWDGIRWTAGYALGALELRSTAADAASSTVGTAGLASQSAALSVTWDATRIYEMKIYANYTCTVANTLGQIRVVGSTNTSLGTVRIINNVAGGAGRKADMQHIPLSGFTDGATETLRIGILLESGSGTFTLHSGCNYSLQDCGPVR